jgi:hypothetical protein
MGSAHTRKRPLKKKFLALPPLEAMEYWRSWVPKTQARFMRYPAIAYVHSSSLTLAAIAAGHYMLYVAARCP